MKTQLKVFKIWQQGHIILIGEPNRIIPLASFRNLYLTSPIANHQILWAMYILSVVSMNKASKNIKLQQMYCIILYQLITSNTLGTQFPLLEYFLYLFLHENVHICNQSQQPYILVIDDHSLSDYQATQLLLTRTQSFYLILCL